MEFIVQNIRFLSIMLSLCFIALSFTLATVMCLYIRFYNYEKEKNEKDIERITDENK